MFDEAARWARLQEAQAKALDLFAAIEPLVRPGVTEGELSAQIVALAKARHGVETHWHKSLVRAGANTLATFWDETAEQTLQADDIMFVDLGPVFEAWEADFGATYVLGGDPAKHALKAALPQVAGELTAWYAARPHATGAELYAEAQAAAERRGYRFAGNIAGHLVGEFPHSNFPGGRDVSLIAPVNVTRMRDLDADGRVRYWILEVHLAELDGRFGGFCEGLLVG